MRNIICFLVLLAGFCASLQAQVFLPGKLILVEGDTLEGLVSEQGGVTWAFKESKNSPTRIYSRRQIQAFERRDEKYEEHEIEVLRGKFPERIKEFLLVVEEGQVRLLRYDGKGIFNSDHIGYYLHEKGMANPLRVNVDPGNFKVQMSQYFGDDTELKARIKGKELGYENIQEIVQQYNNWYKESSHPEEVVVTPKKEKVEKPAKEKKPKKEKSEEEESDGDSEEKEK